MAVGDIAREKVHSGALVRKITFSDLGTTVDIGELPPCIIHSVKSVKVTDFNSGSTATIIVGLEYSDGTSASTAALVSSASLTSSVAQGPLAHTFVDNALAIPAVAVRVTATLGATGTAATTGEAYVYVDWEPLSAARTRNL